MSKRQLKGVFAKEGRVRWFWGIPAGAAISVGWDKFGSGLVQGSNEGRPLTTRQAEIWDTLGANTKITAIGVVPPIVVGLLLCIPRSTRGFGLAWAATSAAYAVREFMWSVGQDKQNLDVVSKRTDDWYPGSSTAATADSSTSMDGAPATYGIRVL